MVFRSELVRSLGAAPVNPVMNEAKTTVNIIAKTLLAVRVHRMSAFLVFGSMGFDVFANEAAK
jgi:hypothetical protein